MTKQTRFSGRAKGVCLLALAVALASCAARQGSESLSATVGGARPSRRSSAEWLALLPDDEEKRRFVLDCTGCHQFDLQSAQPTGQPRTREEWQTAVARMMTYAGATTGFPVISAYRNADATAEWLRYAHSVAIGCDGRAWTNGHFTLAPEIVASVDAASGNVRKYELPLHTTLGSGPGGPIPYEIRVAPDGRVWMSELQGNRLIALDPATGASTVHEMPTSHSGPRRFDIDPRGVLWIPAYSTNELVRYDPTSGAFRHLALPIQDAVP
jgi:hypothetical protein